MHEPGVVVIGNFDGVHRGHQAVLESAVRRNQGPVAVITFWPHPLSVVAPAKAPKLLCDLRTRIDLLREAGASEVRVVSFTRDVAAWTPAQFVARVIDPLTPKCVVVGENFRFGAKAGGDVSVLRDLGQGRFEVHALDLHTVKHVVTCSTEIRARLAEGDVHGAVEHLGRPFRFRGTVVLGDQRGRELGFPTANQSVPDELATPADGVYAGYLTRLDDASATPMPAAISVGTNPTFDGFARRVESHVIGRTDLELYGAEVGIDFVARLRPQVKFDNIDDLVDQMRADVSDALQALS